MTQSQEIKGEALLRQLVGEWQVGIAIKTSPDKVVAGCGDMTAVETDLGISSEINTQIEDMEDYYENNLWSFDPTKNEVHLFSMNSDGENRDYIGKLKDDSTLELEWHGTFEDQEKQKQIRVKWVSKDRIELRETNYRQGKPILETGYVLKRKKAKLVS
jgi:hypothetical protein